LDWRVKHLNPRQGITTQRLPPANPFRLAIEV